MINSISNSRIQPVPEWAINWSMMKQLSVQGQYDLGIHLCFWQGEGSDFGHLIT